MLRVRIRPSRPQRTLFCREDHLQFLDFCRRVSAGNGFCGIRLLAARNAPVRGCREDNQTEENSVKTGRSRQMRLGFILRLSYFGSVLALGASKSLRG